MEKLLNQSTLIKESAEDLQTLHDVSRACVFALSKLGIDQAVCGEIFAHLLIKKNYHISRVWNGKNSWGKASKFRNSIRFLNSSIYDSVHLKLCIPNRVSQNKNQCLNRHRNKIHNRCNGQRKSKKLSHFTFHRKPFPVQ